MDNINIVYVDDQPDDSITAYLAEKYTYEHYKINFEQIIFDCKYGYELLISNSLITKANVIIIDSILFQNNTASNGKFTGEEVKLMLKAYFPFIQVIGITQNDGYDKYGSIKKYRSSNKDYSTALEYYNSILKDELDKSIKIIIRYEEISKKLKHNKNIDTTLIEKILLSLDGNDEYAQLTTSDIDNLIDTFRKLQVSIDEN